MSNKFFDKFLIFQNFLKFVQIFVQKFFEIFHKNFSKIFSPNEFCMNAIFWMFFITFYGFFITFCVNVFHYFFKCFSLLFVIFLLLCLCQRFSLFFWMFFITFCGFFITFCVNVFHYFWIFFITLFVFFDEFFIFLVYDKVREGLNQPNSLGEWIWTSASGTTIATVITTNEMDNISEIDIYCKFRYLVWFVLY